MTPETLIKETHIKYSEWFEVAGEKSPQLMIHILASLLIKEKNENYYLNRRLHHDRIDSAK